MEEPSSLSNPRCSAHPLRCQQSWKHQMCVARHNNEAGLTAPPQKQLHRNEMGEESDEDSLQHLCMKFECHIWHITWEIISSIWETYFSNMITHFQSKVGKAQVSTFLCMNLVPVVPFLDFSLNSFCFFTKLVNSSFLHLSSFHHCSLPFPVSICHGWYSFDYVLCWSQKEFLGFQGKLTGPLSGNANCTYQHSCEWRGWGNDNWTWHCR